MKQSLQERNLQDAAYDYKTLIAIFIVFCTCSVLGVFLYNLLCLRAVVALSVTILVIKKDYLSINEIKAIKN